jgi:hypothetical protein
LFVVAIQYDNSNKKEIVKGQTSAMNGYPTFRTFFSLSRFHGVGVDHGLNNYCIKTPNPKCNLYWCLVEFIDWSGDTVSHVGIFGQLCELLPL